MILLISNITIKFLTCKRYPKTSCNFLISAPNGNLSIIAMDRFIFQSTPPQRRRLDATFESPLFFLISIHASAKEATNHVFYAENVIIISIHASAKEATRMGFRRGIYPQISIHASAKEATIIPCFYCLSIFHFNPRLREGGDPG